MIRIEELLRGMFISILVYVFNYNNVFFCNISFFKFELS